MVGVDGVEDGGADGGLEVDTGAGAGLAGDAGLEEPRLTTP